MYKRYYTPFEEQPVKKEYPAEIIKPKKAEPEQQVKEAEKKLAHSGFLGDLAADDIILIAILLLLLMEDKKNRDIPLILGIGFLLLIDHLDI